MTFEETQIEFDLLLEEAAREFSGLEELERFLSNSPVEYLHLRKSKEIVDADITGLRNELNYTLSLTGSGFDEENDKFLKPKFKGSRKDQLTILGQRIQHLERNLCDLYSKQAFLTSKLNGAHQMLKKYEHVLYRIESLFERVFRQPSSSFIREALLNTENQMLLEQLTAQKSFLCKISLSKDEFMNLIKDFSDELITLKTETSPSMKNTMMAFLVCKVKKDYRLIKKCHPCFPQDIPPIRSPYSKIRLNELREISESDQFTFDELMAALAEYQEIFKRISVVVCDLKNSCQETEELYNQKRHELYNERKQILMSQVMRLERDRALHDSTFPDLPPPYYLPVEDQRSEIRPANVSLNIYPVDEDEEDLPLPQRALKPKNSCPAIKSLLSPNRARRKSLSGPLLIKPISEASSSLDDEHQSHEDNPKKKKPKVPLISLIDQMRTNGFNSKVGPSECKCEPNVVRKRNQADDEFDPTQSAPAGSAHADSSLHSAANSRRPLQPEPPQTLPEIVLDRISIDLSFDDFITQTLSKYCE